jgi:hypothetical protein
MNKFTTNRYQTLTAEVAPFKPEALAKVLAEDKPEEGKQYSLCAIAKGKTWAEAEVK